jgi:hypothetical protein
MLCQHVGHVTRRCVCVVHACVQARRCARVSVGHACVLVFVCVQFIICVKFLFVAIIDFLDTTVVVFFLTFRKVESAPILR